MGESEQLTQREELKNWLGRLSYILHRSDELHENLNGIRGQYRYADHLQIWKRPQFFANRPAVFRGCSWYSLWYFLLRLPMEVFWRLCICFFTIGPWTIGFYIGLQKLFHHAFRRILVAKHDGSTKGVKDYSRLKACEEEHFVSLAIVSHLVPFLLSWTLLGLLIFLGSKNPTTSMLITVLLFFIWQPGFRCADQCHYARGA